MTSPALDNAVYLSRFNIHTTQNNAHRFRQFITVNWKMNCFRPLFDWHANYCIQRNLLFVDFASLLHFCTAINSSQLKFWAGAGFTNVLTILKQSFILGFQNILLSIISVFLEDIRVLLSEGRTGIYFLFTLSDHASLGAL